MFSLFKIIALLFTAKKVYEAPEELVTEVSTDIIKAFFILSLLFLGLLTLLFFALAFITQKNFFCVTALVFAIFFIVDLYVYLRIKRNIQRLSKNFFLKIKKGIRE